MMLFIYLLFACPSEMSGTKNTPVNHFHLGNIWIFLPLTIEKDSNQQLLQAAKLGTQNFFLMCHHCWDANTVLGKLF